MSEELVPRLEMHAIGLSPTNWLSAQRGGRGATSRARAPCILLGPAASDEVSVGKPFMRGINMSVSPLMSSLLAHAPFSDPFVIERHSLRLNGCDGRRDEAIRGGIENAPHPLPIGVVSPRRPSRENVLHGCDERLLRGALETRIARAAV
jgi:hypothetical protein